MIRKTNHSCALWLPVTTALLLAPSAEANTLTVTRTNDSGPASLRRAIQDAAAGDTINLAVTGTITLTSGELLLSKNVTLAGPGADRLDVSGNAASRVFNVASNATVNLSGLTLRNGRAPDGATAGARGGNGGAIYNAGILTITACAISGNSAGNASTAFSANIGVGGEGGAGGGICNIGNLSLTACTVSSNTAGAGGRGVTGGAGGAGGAIYNAGTLVLLDSTVSSNTAGRGGVSNVGRPGPLGGHGGAIYNAGSLAVTAGTLSGNRAGQGGAGMNTRAGNGGNGGGIYNAASASPANLRSTLVGLNTSGAGGRGTGFGQPGSNGIGWDLFGAFTSQSHNLIGAPYPSTGFTNGVNADLVGVSDPMLGPLQNNGGPTPTLALLPGSPALDAGDDSLPGAPFNLATDQRGLARRSGPRVDIGAFERQVAVARLRRDNLTRSGDRVDSVAIGFQTTIESRAAVRPLRKDGNFHGTTAEAGTVSQWMAPPSTYSFSSISRSSDGSIVLTASGPAHQAFRLWASPDLAQPFSGWILLSSGSFGPDGQMSFSDSEAAEQDSPIYRLSQP
ncbi:MAG TPA: choice-of-anchor Q domain-containing protein [Verrucomicrobiota bacterium]|nr:choice-of-anchor Q domain-containing protein [Verrucomicrobiota bacterium]